MIPKELYEEIKKGDCVIFAGAGISTESGIYGKPTFYEEIRSQFEEEVPNLSFPALMQKYCDDFDNGGKNSLIRKIIQRIESFSGDGEIYNVSSWFHRDISTIPTIKKIVTTNWDNFFERELNILVPMVEDKDIPFWNEEKRQILKIHGSITRPETIVATTKDYEETINTQSKKPIFTKLKDLMATKTFLFVGYSLRDKNIQLIYDSVLKKLGSFSRTAYIINPTKDEEVIEIWKKRNIKIIPENSIVFLRELKEKLAKDEVIFDEKYINVFYKKYISLINFHSKTSQTEDILSTMYQDGLIHELQAIFNDYRYGLKTVTEKRRDTRAYMKNKEGCLSKKNPIDYAYWTGRAEALKSFLAKKPKDMNFSFPDSELSILDQKMTNK